MLACQAELFCNIIVLSVTQYDKVTIIALLLRWSYSRIWVLLVLYERSDEHNIEIYELGKT